jgi:hypothetical protein
VIDDDLVVSGLRATKRARIDLTDERELFGFALDQRAFGPRRLVVTFADRRGRLRTIAHTPRTDPPELALEACIAVMGRGAASAVAFADEPAVEGTLPPQDLPERWARARATAEAAGIRLVDWFACDDLAVRSTWIAVHGARPWEWPG